MPLQHLYKPSDNGEALFYTWFTAMHTRVDIAIHGPHDEARLVSLTQDIASELQRLEHIGNFFDPTSELSLVNRLASAQPTPVSPELYHILEACLAFHARTQGYFDVTVPSTPHTPHTIHGIRLQPETHTVRFEHPGTCINLSGFLKGYALDNIRPLLHEAGIRHALVNLGNSSILALGNHPSGKGWKLGHDLVLSDQCLTTSGNEHEGHTHIINPQTGEVTTGKRQIRVITSQGVWGEVCSTALFACPDEHRPALIEALRPELISCHQDTIG